MTFTAVALSFKFKISIHTPTQGVTTKQPVETEKRLNFNPHSHAGSDNPSNSPYNILGNISIHTPTQGVTIFLWQIIFVCIISIHTPTQGVTQLARPSATAVRNFNPHSHAGSDAITKQFVCNLDISIHTPTQGVTASPTIIAALI